MISSKLRMRLIVKSPAPGAANVQMPLGADFVFEKGGALPYYQGEVVGYVKTVVGSTTFRQVEA